MVTACAAGTQIDSACLKTKAAGGEVEAELTTYHALRNSACGYLFLGATTREVAPDAVMAVHNSKLTLTIRWRASAHQIEEIRARDIAKADRERAAFIMAMGISHELNDLIATVKFESLHVSTRAELYRFGVDTRPFRKPHGPWKAQPVRMFTKRLPRKKAMARFERWSGGYFARPRIAPG